MSQTEGTPIPVEAKGGWQCFKHSEDHGLNGMMAIDSYDTVQSALQRIDTLQKSCHDTYGGECDPNCAVKKLKGILENAIKPQSL